MTHRGEKGVTLVELVVVLAVMGILAAVVGPRLTSRNEFDVVSAKEDLASFLRSARSRAVRERRTVFVNVSGASAQACRTATHPCPSGSEVLPVSGAGTLEFVAVSGVSLSGVSFGFGSDGSPGAYRTFTISKGGFSASLNVESPTGYVHE